MFYRPIATRLFAIKFLGIFGSSQIGDKNVDEVVLPDNPKTTPTTKDIENDSRKSPTISYHQAIDSSKRKLADLWLEKGVPGMTICVAKRGKIVWNYAIGYCDVENQVECSTDAKMRIASISKPLFVATVIGPLIDGNKIDIESSVHKYLSAEEFPKQKYDGKETDITIKQLLSHTSGIKHYTEGASKDDPLKPIGSQGSQKIYQCDDQFAREGFFQRQTYRSVVEALAPFKDGPLTSEPGKYKYTTYGFTLLSAVVEKIHQLGEEKSAKEQIEDFWMKVLRRDWHMEETSLDQDEPVLPKRARYYLRSGTNGSLVNAPYTDNSNKWAGGGIVSTTGDLVKFANTLIDSYKGRNDSKLTSDTVSLLWTEVINSYALGFEIKQIGNIEGEKRAILHLGGALGASSVLIIYPDSEVVVAILANLGSINLKPVGLFIADQFSKC